MVVSATWWWITLYSTVFNHLTHGSLAHDPSQAGSIMILAGINQNRLVDSFYTYLPARPCPRLFCDRAILTVRNRDK